MRLQSFFLRSCWDSFLCDLPKNYSSIFFSNFSEFLKLQFLVLLLGILSRTLLFCITILQYLGFLWCGLTETELKPDRYSKTILYYAYLKCELEIICYIMNFFLGQLHWLSIAHYQNFKQVKDLRILLITIQVLQKNYSTALKTRSFAVSQ